MKEITVMYWYDHDVDGWGYVLMTIGMLGFLALVITGLVLLVRQFGRIGGSLTAPRTPEELLAERFARGEIDEVDYISRLAALYGRLRA